LSEETEEPLSDGAKAFFLSVALCCVDAVKSSEKGDTHLSVKKRKKMKALEGDLVKISAIYKSEGFDIVDMNNAGEVVGRINGYIKELYP